MGKRYDVNIPENITANYNAIKESFFSRISGGINPSQSQEAKRKREEELLRNVHNPASMAPGAPSVSTTPAEALHSPTVAQEKMVDPTFLTAITAFFTDYAKEVQSLPS